MAIKDRFTGNPGRLTVPTTSGNGTVSISYSEKGRTVLYHMGFDVSKFYLVTKMILGTNTYPLRDHHTNVPQYPQNTVYGYPPSTVTRQGGELGAQGFAKMTSSYSDNYICTNFGSGDPTRTPLSSLVRDIDKLRECMMVRSSGSDDMDACRLERHLAGGWRHVVPKQERVRKNMFKVQPDTVTRMLVWFRPLSPLHRTNLNRRRTKIVSTRGWNS
uniref:Uncharacterized protein n=2 Tax=Oryza sativa subsp. japonica TaxID=39947 RepID=Q8S846_ORYSJ|nr:Hypothetical protein [Oryza sativa Japonica Group]AAP52915.1 hypothetical protein LOC_Os10g17270 [Oryza sativa Japonica Group]